MEMDILNGQMDPAILDSFQKTIYTEMAYTSGLTNASMKVNGRITKCTAKACLHGLMAVSTKVTSTRTRSRAMVFLLGLMVVNTTGNGLMVNSMAWESI